MTKTLEFELSLIPENNPYHRMGLICNPFDGGTSPRPSIMRGLKYGVSKSSLKRFLPMIGLTEKVVDLIVEKVKANYRYFIHVEWDSIAGKGILVIKGIKGEDQEVGIDG